jgi:hypothetical protein
MSYFTETRNLIVICLMPVLLVTGCAVGVPPTLTPALTTMALPTYTPQLSATELPTTTSTLTITSTPTITPTPTISPTPTITPTPPATPIAGAGTVLLPCNISGDARWAEYQYDLATSKLDLLSEIPEDNKSWIMSQMQVGGLSRTQSQQYVQLMPDEWNKDCCLRFLGATKDGSVALFHKLGPTTHDPIYIYWLSLKGESRVLYTDPSSGMPQENVYNPKHELIAIRQPLKQRDTILIFDIANGTAFDLTPSSSGDNGPWRVNFSPDGESITYSDNDGTWITSLTGEDRKLLIKNGFDADISPDGKQVVYGSKPNIRYMGSGELYVANIDGTNPQPLLDPKTHTAVRGESPQWVPNIDRQQIVYTGVYGLGFDYNLIDAVTHSKKNLLPYQTRFFSTPGEVYTWSPDGLWFLKSHITSGGEAVKSYLCSIDAKKCVLLDPDGPEGAGGCGTGDAGTGGWRFLP